MISSSGRQSSVSQGNCTTRAGSMLIPGNQGHYQTKQGGLSSGAAFGDRQLWFGVVAHLLAGDRAVVTIGCTGRAGRQFRPRSFTSYRQGETAPSQSGQLDVWVFLGLRRESRSSSTTAFHFQSFPDLRGVGSQQGLTSSVSSYLHSRCLRPQRALNSTNADSCLVNILATIWLIAWPASIVMRMKLRRRVKRTLLISFGSALILLASEIFHCVNLLFSISSLIEHSGRLEVRWLLIIPAILN